MISFTSAQIEQWLVAYLWPLTRFLGLMAVAPILGHNRVPMRLRVGLAVVLTILVVPALPPAPAIDPGSAAGLLALAGQMLIGLSIGLVMRMALAAVEMAGEIAGTQMGFGFALFYDPAHFQQMPVLGQFVGVFASLLFLSLDGHLMMISVLAESFRSVPLGAATPLAGIATLAQFGSSVFAAGLALALPIVVTLVAISLALGVLTRAAPQLNVFAVGFPVTLGVGMATVLLALPFWVPSVTELFDLAFRRALALGR